MLTRRRLFTLSGVALATLWSRTRVSAQTKKKAPKLTEVTLTISGMT